MHSTSTCLITDDQSIKRIYNNKSNNWYNKDSVPPLEPYKSLLQKCTLLLAELVILEKPISLLYVTQTLFRLIMRSSFPSYMMLFSQQSNNWACPRFKVIPHNCIAHPFGAYFMASFSAPSCTHTLKTWQICLDVELCQLKNGIACQRARAPHLFFKLL